MFDRAIRTVRSQAREVSQGDVPRDGACNLHVPAGHLARRPHAVALSQSPYPFGQPLPERAPVALITLRQPP